MIQGGSWPGLAGLRGCWQLQGPSVCNASSRLLAGTAPHTQRAPESGGSGGWGWRWSQACAGQGCL